jgi:cytochrome c oxidase subunit 3
MSHQTLITPAPAGFKPHRVAHHFSNFEQEFQASKLGFWLFLATEVMLFGGLFAAYIIFHGHYEETFRACGKQLSWQLGGLNTIILLTSSWTMAMGVRASQTSRKQAMQTWLFLTILCALGFMVVKYFEYGAKFDHGLLPGYWFSPHGEYATLMSGLAYPNLFFSMYFTMTSIHGLHVLGGIFAISWLMWGGARNKYHAGYYMPVELVGLYWHIVDLIWIFLFPLLYLVP